MFFYYYIVFFVVALYLFLTKNKVKNAKSIFLLTTFLLLIFISAIRADSVGGDLGHYLPHYKIFGEMQWSQLFAHRSKYGYIFATMCKIVYMINPSPQSFLIVTSCWSLIPIYFFIKKYSANPLMSVFIYITFGFYTNTFNSVRSSIALGIGVLLFDYVIERKLWKFLILFLLGVEIHYTFLLFGVIYPLYKKEITLKYILVSIGLCFVSSQVASIWSNLYGMALAYDEGAYRNLSQSSGGYTLLALMVAITFFFFFVKKNFNNVTKMWMHCMIVACCVLCFATSLTLLTRVAMFFYIVIVVLFPEIYKSFSNPYLLRFGKYAIFVMFFVYFSFFVMKPLKEYDGSNNQRTIPYKTFGSQYEI